MLFRSLALLISTASAQDSNGDGCVDSYADANTACVSVDADTTTGLTVGSGAQIQAYASVGADSTLGADAVIAARASFAGRSGEPGAATLGTNSIIARGAVVGVDAQIADDVTIGRVSQVGERFSASTGAQVGYGSDIGDDVSVAANVTVGSLANVGNHTTLQAGALIARGVQISDSVNSGSATEIAGMIGPNSTIGRNVTVSSGARIRKNTNIADDVTIGPNVRIGRSVTIEDNVSIADGARISAYATLESGAVIGTNEVVPHGATVEGSGPIDVADQHTAPGGQTVYRLEYRPLPAGDARAWYRDACLANGLAPVSCDYFNWGGAGGNYDATAWGAVILEKTYWSCNVSSGVMSKTGWSNVLTFHVPNGDSQGVCQNGCTITGAQVAPICTDPS